MDKKESDIIANFLSNMHEELSGLKRIDINDNLIKMIMLMDGISLSIFVQDLYAIDKNLQREVSHKEKQIGNYSFVYYEPNRFNLLFTYHQGRIKINAVDVVSIVPVKETLRTYITNSGSLLNEQIREMFLIGLERAKEDIYIITPWINSIVLVDYGVKDLFEKALKRGVRIRILYGYENRMSHREEKWREKVSDEMANMLRNDFIEYGDLFALKRTHTHIKRFVCDKQFALRGSLNFLSFAGDYSRKSENTYSSIRDEDSLIIQNPIDIQTAIDEFWIEEKR